MLQGYEQNGCRWEQTGGAASREALGCGAAGRAERRVWAKRRRPIACSAHHSRAIVDIDASRSTYLFSMI